jgi:hypothetical protein
MRITGDSVSMLTLITKMRPPSNSPALGLIAREMALDVADMVYAPDVAAHIPGIANVVADSLSRRFEAPSWRCPELLAEVKEAHPPRRDASFIRTLRHSHDGE